MAEFFFFLLQWTKIPAKVPEQSAKTQGIVVQIINSA